MHQHLKDGLDAPAFSVNSHEIDRLWVDDARPAREWTVRFARMISAICCNGSESVNVLHKYFKRHKHLVPVLLVGFLSRLFFLGSMGGDSLI